MYIYVGRKCVQCFDYSTTKTTGHLLIDFLDCFVFFKTLWAAGNVGDSARSLKYTYKYADVDFVVRLNPENTLTHIIIPHPTNPIERQRESGHVMVNSF